jgi:replicative DNA helicase
MQDTMNPDEIVERLLAIMGWLGPRLHQTGLDATTLRDLAEQASKELRDVATPLADAPLFAQADSLIDDLLSDYGKRQAAAAAHGGVVGVRTGLDHLDETLNGLEPGKLYMLAAMPGTGKTTLALQWAATVAQNGHGALYISLENDATDLARKTACRLGDVSYAAALKGKLSRQEWATAVDQLRKLHGRLYLSTPRTTMPSLPSLVEGILTRTGAAPALIVVDYLQAMVKRAATGADASDVRERIDRFAPELRAIGEEYGAAVLAISSQNRSGYKDGGMAAMKESGDLEYNSDAVLTLSRLDDKELKARGYDITHDPRTTPLKLVVEKNRSGLTGRPIPLLLDGDHCMVEEEGL